MSRRSYDKAGLGAPNYHQRSALLAQGEVIHKGVQKVLTSASGSYSKEKKGFRWNRTRDLKARLSRPVPLVTQSWCWTHGGTEEPYTKEQSNWWYPTTLLWLTHVPEKLRQGWSRRT
jgi:hypothetical protein